MLLKNFDEHLRIKLLEVRNAVMGEKGDLFIVSDLRNNPDFKSITDAIEIVSKTIWGVSKFKEIDILVGYTSKYINQHAFLNDSQKESSEKTIRLLSDYIFNHHEESRLSNDDRPYMSTDVFLSRVDDLDIPKTDISVLKRYDGDHLQSFMDFEKKLDFFSELSVFSNDSREKISDLIASCIASNPLNRKYFSQSNKKDHYQIENGLSA